VLNGRQKRQSVFSKRNGPRSVRKVIEDNSVYSDIPGIIKNLKSSNIKNIEEDSPTEEEESE
jgi:hypothetical protein